MAYAPLALVEDVEDVWRPLTGAERTRATNLVWKASALLRQRLPSVDARMAKFAADPTDAAGLDPVAVATVVATVVKKFLSNPSGASSQSLGSATLAYGTRGDKDVRGELRITESDIASLLAPASGPRLASIRVHPTLAPWPYGDIAGPTLSDVAMYGTPDPST